MEEWDTLEYRFATLGIEDPFALDARRFVSLVTGWLMDGRSKEDRDKLTRILEGDSEEIDKDLDDRLADTYREDGMSDLRVKMMEEIRHAKTPMERAEIRVKYSGMAREEAEAANG